MSNFIEEFEIVRPDMGTTYVVSGRATIDIAKVVFVEDMSVVVGLALESVTSVILEVGSRLMLRISHDAFVARWRLAKQARP